MANTTSGTTIFEKGFSIADIVEESYERIGIQGVSGYQLKTARRSLNIMFQEWGKQRFALLGSCKQLNYIS